MNQNRMHLFKYAMGVANMWEEAFLLFHTRERMPHLRTCLLINVSASSEKVSFFCKTSLIICKFMQI